MSNVGVAEIFLLLGYPHLRVDGAYVWASTAPSVAIVSSVESLVLVGFHTVDLSAHGIAALISGLQLSDLKAFQADHVRQLRREACGAATDQRFFDCEHKGQNKQAWKGLMDVIEAAYPAPGDYY